MLNFPERVNRGTRNKPRSHKIQETRVGTDKEKVSFPDSLFTPLTLWKTQSLIDKRNIKVNGEEDIKHNIKEKKNSTMFNRHT